MIKATWISLVILLAIAFSSAIALAQQAPPSDPVETDLKSLIPTGSTITVDLATAAKTRNSAAIQGSTVDAGGQTVLISRMVALTPSSSTLAILDADTGDVTGTLDTSVTNADSISASKDGSRVFVTSSSQGTLTVLDTTVTPTDDLTLTEAGSIWLSSTPIRTAAIPGTTKVAVIGSQQLDVVDASTMTVPLTVSFSADAVGLAALNDPNFVSVTLANGEVFKVDITTGTAGTPVQIGSGAVDVALCDSATEGVADRLLITDPVAATVTVLDAASFTVIDVVNTSITDPERIATGTVFDDPATGEPTEMAFLSGSGNTISVVDCDAAAATFLDQVSQIVAMGPVLGAAATSPGADPRVFASRGDRESILLIDATFFSDPARSQIFSDTSGVPGSEITATGFFPDGTNFIVEISGVPFAFLTPITLTQNQATFLIPLNVPVGVELGIWATSSTDPAVFSTGNFLWSSRLPFQTLDTLGGLDALIASLQAIVDDPTTPQQIRVELEAAISELTLAKTALNDSGAISTAFTRFQTAFAKMQNAIALGASLGVLPQRLVEIAQSLDSQKLAPLTVRLGSGDPLLTTGQGLFDTGSWQLRNGDLAGALQSFEDSFNSLGPAIDAAHPLTKEQSLPLIENVVDSDYDTVEQLRLLQATGTLTASQSAEIDLAIADLGPAADGTFTNTAILNFVQSDVPGGVALVKQAIERLDNLIHNESVPVFTITKKQVQAMLDLAEGCANASEINVGPHDPEVIFMRQKIEEARPLLNPHFSEAMLLLLQAVGNCVFYTFTTQCSIALIPGPVPDLFEGTSCSTDGEDPFEIKYLLLIDSFEELAYVRITVRDSSADVQAVVFEGILPEGIHTATWNGLGIPPEPEPGEPQEPAPVVPAGTYEMHYEAWCILNGMVTVQVTGSQQFEIVPKPDGVYISSSSLSFTAPEDGLNPEPQVVRLSIPEGSVQWSASTDSPWIKVFPDSGTLQGCSGQEFQVSVDNAGLTAGPYFGLIKIAAGGAPLQFVAVDFLITEPGPTILLSESDVTLVALEGGVNPATRSVLLTNSGASNTQLNWSSSSTETWLGLQPASGSLGGGQSESLAVSVNTAGLTTAASPYSGILTVSDPAGVNSPQFIQVTVLVADTAAKLDVQAGPLSFSATQGQTALFPVTVNITNLGPAGTVLLWQAKESRAWMSVFPGFGFAQSMQSTPMMIRVDVTGLKAEDVPYAGTIVVYDDAAQFSPQTIDVSLLVKYAPAMIGVAPETLSFRATQDGMPPLEQFATVTNVGDPNSLLVWNASVAASPSWIAVSPSSGTLLKDQSAQMTVSVPDMTGLTAAASPHTDTITIDATQTTANPGATNSPGIQVDLTLDPPGPTIRLSTYLLSFTAFEDQTPPADQGITITNAGPTYTTLDWSVVENIPWLTVDPTAAAVPLPGFQSEPITVSVDHAGLTTGVTYTDSFTIEDPDPNAVFSEVTVQVTLTVNPSSAKLELLTPTLSFRATQDGMNPPDDAVKFKNEDLSGSTLDWTSTATQSWLILNPPTTGQLGSGESHEMTVSVDITGLTAGDYSDTITITANGQVPQATIAVFLTIDPPGPTIRTLPNSLTFTGQEGQTVAETQQLSITNSGPPSSQLDWSASSNGSWLSIQPATGSVLGFQSQDVSVLMNVGSLTAAGSPYSAEITIDGNGINAPHSIPVTLTVEPAPFLQVLFPDTGVPAGGDVVTLFGSNLSDAAQVTFGASNPAGILSNTDTQIKVVAPASPDELEGTVTVTVISTAGSVSNGLTYTYELPSIDDGPAFTDEIYEFEINNSSVTTDDIVGLQDKNLDGFQAPAVVCRIKRKLPNPNQSTGTTFVVIQNVAGGGNVGLSLSAGGPFTSSELVSVSNDGVTWTQFYVVGTTKSTQTPDTVIYAIEHEQGGGRARMTVLEADLDVDSDNDGQVELQDGPEDLIELGSPGKAVCLNNDDDDVPGTPDNLDDELPSDPAKRTLDLKDMAELKIRETPANLGVGTVVIETSNKERVRIFDHTYEARLGPETAGPNASSYSIPLDQLKNSDRTWYIEGVVQGEVTLTIKYLRSGDSELLDDDKVTLIVVDIDLDIDSDNDGTIAEADDPIEDDTDKPGKIILTNDLDYAGNGVPGFADGIDIHGNEGANRSNAFTPITLTIPDFVDKTNAKIRFAYQDSDPARVSRSPASGDDPLPVYGTNSPTNQSFLRVWKKDGLASRKVASVSHSSPGDYVPPGEHPAVQIFGTTNSVTLYVEGIRESAEGEARIEVTLLVTGTSLTGCTDAVRLTPAKLRIHYTDVTGINGIGATVRANVPRIGRVIQPDGIACDWQADVDDGALLLMRVLGSPVLHDLISKPTPEMAIDFGYTTNNAPPTFSSLPNSPAREGEFKTLDDVGFVPDANAALADLSVATIGGAVGSLRVLDARFYKPPAEFDLTSPLNALEERKLNLAVNVTGKVAGRGSKPHAIALVRPPLVLVHGINPSPTTWDEFVTQFENWGFHCDDFRVDHKVVDPALAGEGNTEGFGEVSNMYSFVRDMIGGSSSSATNSFRAGGYFKPISGSGINGKRIAVQKADLGAHSYGGLLSRWYIERAGTPPGQEFQDRKDVRKLVTLGTPHRGTPLANMVCEVFRNGSSQNPVGRA